MTQSGSPSLRSQFSDSLPVEAIVVRLVGKRFVGEWCFVRIVLRAGIDRYGDHGGTIANSLVIIGGVLLRHHDSGLLTQHGAITVEAEVDRNPDIVRAVGEGPVQHLPVDDGDIAGIFLDVPYYQPNYTVKAKGREC